MSKDRCGCGTECCDNYSNDFLGFGGCNWIWIILLIILFCPGIFGGYDHGCGCGGFGGGNYSWIWILILIIFFIPGFGFGKCGC